ncbi:MAG: glycosyl transferase, partial [Gammaproteobacteria bacterium]|nr:glycosyl transferase [Gammaproteobacteria bacterium]
MLLAAVLGGLFIASFLLTGAIRRFALRGGMLDFPVSRSLHEEAKPVGGGAVIAVLFLAYAGAYYLQGSVPSREFLALAGGALVALVGLFDDLWKLSLGWRMPAQFAAAIWAVSWVGERLL